VIVHVSVTLALLVITVVLCRTSGLRAGHAVVCVLLGFYLSDSSMAPVLDDLTRAAAGLVSSIRI